MYSPGNWYLRVPRRKADNVRFRLYVLKRCREDRRFKKAVIEMCREDILFFVNVFVWQFNPNAIGDFSTQCGPFVTAGFQDEAVKTILDCIHRRKDLVIEKSREMGASWLCLIVMLWFWLFHPYMKFLCVSRNADAVDDSDDSDSLFWKLDYILRLLPDWMVPRHNRRVMAFNNLDNGSQITGQASTGKLGVGGRATAIFIDEYSQIREDWEVLERTSDTSGCRIFNGTHKGTNTAFFELTVKANSSPHLIKKLVMHWTSHPDKARGMYRFDRETQRVEYAEGNYDYPRDFTPVTDGSPTGGPFPGWRSPWYDEAAGRKGSARGVAADLDINPTGSIEQVFDPLVISELKRRYGRQPELYELEFDALSATPSRLWRHETGNLQLWFSPDASGLPPPGRYVAACDIAEGRGATPSCLALANAATGEKLLEFTSASIESKEFAYLAVAICRLFVTSEGRPARLAWEVPGPGLNFGKHVILLGHTDVYYRTTDHRLKREISDSPGWTNSPDSMKFLITNYKDALRSNSYLNHSEPALDECLSFVYGPDGYPYHTGFKSPKDPSSARINHGDRVVADALCWKLIDELGRLARSPAGAPQESKPPATGLAWRAGLAAAARPQGWAD